MLRGSRIRKNSRSNFKFERENQDSVNFKKILNFKYRIIDSKFVDFKFKVLSQLRDLNRNKFY